MKGLRVSESMRDVAAEETEASERVGFAGEEESSVCQSVTRSVSSSLSFFPLVS